MSSILPINVEDLLAHQGVESARVEFKASWDESTTGLQVLHTICAFANDFQNLNGGYVVIGVAERENVAILPPKGLEPAEQEAAQRWLRGRCNTIDPVYQPVFSPERVDGRLVLVIWAPGSQIRPHQVPDGGQRGYFIRLGSETVRADKKPELLTQLMQLTARIPFDARRNLQASLLDLRETKVREFLHDVRSGLEEMTDTRSMYRLLGASDPVNGHDAPRNVALMFFSQRPEAWFPGAFIEVVQFAGDAAGNVIEEKRFKDRPIHEQLRECLAYLDGLAVRQLQKLPSRPEAARWVGFPVQALREALVNAVYHRSYDATPEPTKVYLYPDRMEIISYPGPVSGIEIDHLNGSKTLPPVPARNRHIGEWLKELRLAEGRGTGLPKLRKAMRENGSPQPRFDFDLQRTYFRVTLPAHPEYQAITTLLDVARLKAVGEREGALSRLREAWRAAVGQSPTLALELARELIDANDLPAAEAVYEEESGGVASAALAPLITLIAAAHLDHQRPESAAAWLDRLPNINVVADAIDAAVQEKRAGRLERSHKYFTLAGSAVSSDVRALHEFAQVKLRLALKAKPRGQKGAGSWPAHNRLMDEARAMLQRVVQMEAPRTRLAWAWFDLARVLRALRMPESEAIQAFDRAIEFDPTEHRFSEERARSRASGRS